MTATKLAVTCCAVCVVLTTIVIAGREDPHQNSDQQTVEELKAEIEALKNQTALMGKHMTIMSRGQGITPIVVSQRINKGDDSPEEADGDGVEKIDEEKIRERNQRLSDATEALYSKTLADELRNTEWENEARAELEQFINKEQLGQTSVRSLYCSQSLCKSVLVHDDMTARMDFMQKALLLPVWNTNQFGMTEEIDNKMVQTVYFSAQGERLPSVPLPSNENT